MRNFFYQLRIKLGLGTRLKALGRRFFPTKIEGLVGPGGGAGVGRPGSDVGPSAKGTAAAGAGEVELAVVIPVWRARYLGAALDSLRAQADRGFRVYVGDDASPDDVAGVVARHGAGLDVVYQRFEENLGGRDLVGQWERCIGLTRGESWIWLFADDDEAEPGCVAGWRRAQARPENAGVELFRFDLVFIDGDGREVRAPSPGPSRESGTELLRAMLRGAGREWRAPEHIFSRRVHQETGGVVNLPMALYADLATWVKFAGAGAGLVTVPGSRLRWRAHAGGTSSGRRVEHQAALLAALFGFMRWLAGEGRLRRGGGGEAGVTGGELRRFFWRELQRIEPPLAWHRLEEAWAVARELGASPAGLGRLGLAFGWSRVRHWPAVHVYLTRRYRKKLGLKHEC